MIFRTFDNREVNSKIDNKIEESIKVKVKTVSISRIFILNFDNSALMFKEIIKVVYVVHQSISAEKEKELNLKK